MWYSSKLDLEQQAQEAEERDPRPFWFDLEHIEEYLFKQFKPEIVDPLLKITETWDG